jgi:ribosome biogenesis protein UTP30
MPKKSNALSLDNTKRQMVLRNKAAAGRARSTPEALAAALTESKTRVPDTQVRKAVQALYAFQEKRTQEREAKQSESGVQTLFDDEEDILLVFGLQRISTKSRTKPYAFPIKHSIYGRDGSDVCLITKDPQKTFEELLELNPVDGITRTLSVSTLRKEFSRYKNQRELMNLYDLFLVDDRVVPMLPALLGKHFFRRNRQPLPVNIRKSAGSSFQQVLADARDSAMLYPTTGPCWTVRIARNTMTAQEVYENIVNSLHLIVRRIPGEWKNILSIHMKSTTSVSLPLYATAPSTRTLMSNQDLGEDFEPVETDDSKTNQKSKKSKKSSKTNTTTTTTKTATTSTGKKTNTKDKSNNRAAGGATKKKAVKSKSKTKRGGRK